MTLLRVIFPALLLMLSLSCKRATGSERGDGVDTSAHVAFENSIEEADLTAYALHMADSLLSEMTPEERVGQCFMPTVYAKADEESLRRLAFYIDSLKVGGIVLLKGHLDGASEMASRCMSARIPLFTAIDAEWGLGMRLVDAPDFPRNGHLAATVDEQLLFDYGREVGRECRRVGINMVLGPVVDVAGGKESFIGSRSFGNDPRRVADLGVAYARGVESCGVISVAKHFPGHGSPAGDSHRSLPVIDRSLHQLDSVDLYPFRQYINAGLSGVMVGHLAVPAIDPAALPAAVSEVVIDGLLRRDLGFEGLVITDALNMGGAAGYGAADALKAGADIVTGVADTPGELASSLQALKEGRLSEAAIADRCRRILFYKMLLNIRKSARPSRQGLLEDVSCEAATIKARLKTQ
ncbi:MAG: hypothetical protein HDS35_05130 [Bacteroides sp.]|nr:hypothetical protein [Bacteroides sp.]